VLAGIRPFCLLLLSLLACDSQGPAADAFRVALLTPGSVSDGGWNEGAYEGLKRIERELGARVSHVETRTPAEFYESFRGYGVDGFRLIFGHGFEYQEAAARAADEFPGAIFVTTSGNTVRENLAPMVFALEEATYLCGVLGARLSRSGVLGLVGGVDLPSIRSTFVAFDAGARSVRADVDVREVFLGNFDDSAAAREAAAALISEGADFLMHQANDAGRGVFEAARAGGVRGCGTNRDQSALAPMVVVASAVLDLPAAFVRVAHEVADGSFRARPRRLGMSEGVVSFVWNEALRGDVPETVREELRALEEGIRGGTVTVPRHRALDGS
jgi:basic membrane lipoprotein Med (substrate-binding protein (PBP1-ABC) superfamily)